MSARAARVTILSGLCLGVLATLLLAMPGRAAAGERDWNRTDDPLYESLGLHAGKIGGTGLAFKFPIQWWLYGQVAGGIWHTSSDKRHNGGVMLQYLLRQDRTVRFFVTAGLGYYYHKERGYDGVNSWQVKDTWNSGFGVGVEFLRGERWAIQVEADFTHESNDDSIILFPQAGAFFYF